jgi:hypothetical protein
MTTTNDTCHRDGSCRCAALGENAKDSIGNVFCRECGSYSEHCECGCTCAGDLEVEEEVTR